ncbi:MAG: cyclic nucleotide-binding domain-containing protein [Thermoanaerobaculales bacterium]|jgi:CRP-like cAMP-binding protein|nr:cyclic nucleotide-binding domain-containing protein [Thermoanaerobaculales bacterium]
MRQEELIRAISDSPFFKGMVPDVRSSLADHGRVAIHSSGEMLFRPGRSATALYLILEGVVEISREVEEGQGIKPVAYLGPGAVLGESKVITGTALKSQARFPEGGSTIQWPRPLVLRKVYESRDFSLHYLQNIARRLEGTFASLDSRGSSNLGGMLDHFDLPTILQTVVESGSSGVVEIRDREGDTFGAVYTRERRVGPILCGTLSGEEAFVEIMVSPPAGGTFRFSTIGRQQETEESYHLQPLLFEAVRVKDEFNRFAAEVPPAAVLRHTGRLPENGGPMADQVLKQVNMRPLGWGGVADRLPYAKGRVALTVRDLLLAQVLETEIDYRVSGVGGDQS